MNSRNLPYILMTAAMLIAACTDNPSPDTPEGEDPDVPPVSGLTGYADPEGVLLLSGGEYTMENAFLTFIAPDGTLENRVYASANASELGNDGVGMSMSEGKQYILCNDWRRAEGKENNGLLIVADAQTLRKEQSFSRAQMTFRHPVNGTMEEVDESLGGIAVLDSRNVFIFAQGVLRFDCSTGGLSLVEGSYEIGNMGTANTVESTVSPRGATVVDGRMYALAGGFWSSTALLEFSKGEDAVSRRLELGKGDLVSGMCRTEDGTLVAATYYRSRPNSGFLYFIDVESWSIVDQKTVTANISPGTHSNSGITRIGDYIYFTGAEESEFSSSLKTTLSRFSLGTGRTEKDIVDFRADEPDANILDCNVTGDPDSGLLYVVVSQENMEGLVPQSHILVYDCSVDPPQLVRKISGLTHYVTGIYPM